MATCDAVSAPSASYTTAQVVFNRRIADRTHRIRLECPGIAALARPGQFAMLRIPDRNDPLLARPLAVYETFSDKSTSVPGGLQRSRSFVDFIYLVHGKFTTALQHLTTGSEIAIWGPLGNGFGMIPAVEHLVLVAGGIGQTALLSLGRERLGPATRVTLCWGARTAAMFGDVDDFRDAGIDVHLATLDGSTGLRGTVVDLLDSLLPEAANRSGRTGAIHIACCGPEPMMAAVSRWTAGRGLGCHVSLEAPMACGVGICFTCVAKIRDAGQTSGWDYRRTCVEGPVFEAGSIVWER